MIAGKTAKVAHYVAWHSESSKIGAAALNDVMWRADVLHYRRHGRSITGQLSYVLLGDGPAPNGMKEALESLKADGAIVEQNREIVAMKRIDPVWFWPEEVETLREVMEVAAPAGDLADGPIWSGLLNDQLISIRAASVVSSEVLESDIEWAVKNWGAFDGEQIPLYVTLAGIDGEVTDEALEWADGEIAQARTGRRV